MAFFPFRDLLYVLIPTPGQVDDDQVILFPPPGLPNQVSDRVRGFERRKDAFPSAQDIKGLHGLPVGLSDHTVPSQESFEAAMRAAPAVRECQNTTGIFEYLLRVELPDIAAYKKFHVDVLGGLPQVNSITTYVVMDSPKDDRG